MAVVELGAHTSQWLLEPPQHSFVVHTVQPYPISERMAAQKVPQRLQVVRPRQHPHVVTAGGGEDDPQADFRLGALPRLTGVCGDEDVHRAPETMPALIARTRRRTVASGTWSCPATSRMSAGLPAPVPTPITTPGRRRIG